MKMMRPFAMEPKNGMRATTSKAPSLLLPFYQYLLYRMKSDNLELLQRVVTEFLTNPQRLHTVDSMLRLAFPLVALLPVDIKDTDKRAQADAILTCMKCVRESEVRRAKRAFQELRVALSGKIMLKNWDWLAQIFNDFCVGEEHCLVEFIRLQRQAISIIPTSPIAGVYPLEPVARPIVAKRRSVFEQSSEAGGASDSSEWSEEVTSRRRIVKINLRKASAGPRLSKLEKIRGEPLHLTLSPALQQDRHIICKTIQAIERTEPWVTVFDVSKIQYPFDPSVHKILALKLKRFWESHARAVWERPFWYKYDVEKNGVEAIRERRARQERAAQTFTKSVVKPAYRALGPQFFVDLDNPTTPCYWWWYRQPYVNVMSIGVAHGLKKCLAYLRENATERFPNSPQGFQIRMERHNTEILSMWSTRATEETMHKAIQRLKKASQAGKVTQKATDSD